MTFVTHDARRLRIDHDFHHDRLSERSYLFTMSDITRPHEASRLNDGCERLFLCERAETPAGGARRDRTDDLLLAKQALSQLSYGPSRDQASDVRYQEERILMPDPCSLMPGTGGPGKI